MLDNIVDIFITYAFIEVFQHILFLTQDQIVFLVLLINFVKLPRGKIIETNKYKYEIVYVDWGLFS